MQYNENSKRSTTKIMCNQNVSKPYLPDRLLNRADDLLFCRILLDHGDCHNCMSTAILIPLFLDRSRNIARIGL